MSEAVATHAENLIDDDLQRVLGDRYISEKAKPAVAEYEEVTEGEPSILSGIKWPVFFLALGAFIGWTGHVELMDSIIAVPGMCVCAACFGWHIHK